MKAVSLAFLVLFASMSLFSNSKQASYPSLKEAKKLPENCNAQSSEQCLFHSLPGYKWALNRAPSLSMLGSNSSVLSKKNGDANQWHFVSGELWIEGNQEWLTEFGSVECVGCSLYMVRSKTSVKIQVSKGLAILKAKNSKSNVQVPAGYENEMSSVEISTGIAKTAFPRPIVFKSFVKKWAQFFEGNKEEFLQEVKLFQRHWTVAVYSTAEQDKSYIERELASETKKKEQKKQRKETVEASEKAMRDLFRKRSLGI